MGTIESRSQNTMVHIAKSGSDSNDGLDEFILTIGRGPMFPLKNTILIYPEIYEESLELVNSGCSSLYITSGDTSYLSLQLLMEISMDTILVSAMNLL